MYRPLRPRQAVDAVVAHMARAERVAEVLGADEVLEDRPGAFAEGRATGDVELRDVAFAYEADRPCSTASRCGSPPASGSRSSGRRGPASRPSAR